MRITTLLATLALPLLSLATAMAEEPVNLVPEGNFQSLDATGQPMGWSINPGNYGAFGTTFGIETENEENHIRIANTTTNSTSCWLNYTLPFTDPVPKKLVIRAMIRAKDLKLNLDPATGGADWACAQIDGQFQKMDTTYISHIGTSMRIKASTDGWLQLEQNVMVPEGAEQLVLQVGMWFSNGSVEFKDVKVYSE